MNSSSVKPDSILFSMALQWSRNCWLSSSILAGVNPKYLPTCSSILTIRSWSSAERASSNTSALPILNLSKGYWRILTLLSASFAWSSSNLSGQLKLISYCNSTSPKRSLRRSSIFSKLASPCLISFFSVLISSSSWVAKSARLSYSSSCFFSFFMVFFSSK